MDVGTVGPFHPVDREPYLEAKVETFGIYRADVWDTLLLWPTPGHKHGSKSKE